MLYGRSWPQLNLRVGNCEIIPRVAEWQQNAVLAESLVADTMLGLLKQQEAVKVVYPVRRQGDLMANSIRHLNGQASRTRNEYE